MADAGDIIAVVALILVILALYVMVLQSAAQYIGTLREQYRHCNDRVIGDWASGREYRFHFRDYRFEMMIKVPVLFTSGGPGHRESVYGNIYCIGEREESKPSTPTTNQKGPRSRNLHLSSSKAVGFEQATWLAMLSSLQAMEDESANCEKPSPAHPHQSPYSRTMHVSFGEKRLSWDAMPANFRRPLAFTSMGDLVVIAAMLGTHWKMLNRHQSSYYADGNGLMFESSKVDGIGLVFSFRRTGRATFGKHRILPVIELNELSFGRVPTIFNKANNKTPQPTFLVEPISSGSDDREIPRSDALETLQLGNPEETAATLEAIGCHWKTVDYFKRSCRCTHLFPVPFELVGMLARNMHPENCPFRMLPNPTYTRWNANVACSLFPKLHRAYNERLKDTQNGSKTQPSLRGKLLELSTEILESLNGSKDSKAKTEPESRSNDPRSLTNLLKGLHEGVEGSNELLDGYPRKLIATVLSAHIDRVMGLINQPTNGSGIGEAKTVPDFIKSYIDTVMPEVVKKPPDNTDKEKGGDILLILVFRMLCWLTLHGFHPEDVQAGQGAFYQSELPVYIN
ncbi:hypothetical protein NUW58_g1795 [Xylaria curta]|uniref:Uncharacterized protein n=1 Tax=Xylaria curta TaxID=42375 RepID=A0ACC1PLV6_9PEZI|nr:hypothetical protein NUW58_g1795 [Xylaria curta]